MAPIPIATYKDIAPKTNKYDLLATGDRFYNLKISTPPFKAKRAKIVAKVL
jgi:hypothetical protein